MSLSDEDLFNFDEEPVSETLCANPRNDFPPASSISQHLFDSANNNPEQEIPPTLPNGRIPELQKVSENVSDLLNRVKELETEMKLRDETLEQLSIACRLKAELEKNEGKRPTLIGCEISSQWLSTGSHVVVLELENRIEKALKDWRIMVEWNFHRPENIDTGSESNPASCFKSSQTHSRCATVPVLPPQTKFKLDFFCSGEIDLKLPLQIRCSLMKSFKFRDPRRDKNYDGFNEKTVMISLKNHFCTSWDLVQTRTDATWIPPGILNEEFGRRNRFSIKEHSAKKLRFGVSKLLAHGLCNGEATSERLVKWLLPNSVGDLSASLKFEPGNSALRNRPEDSEDVAICSDLTVGGHSEVSLKVTVTNEHETVARFVVTVDVCCSETGFQEEKGTKKAVKSSDEWVEEFRLGIFAKFKLLMKDMTLCPNSVCLDGKVLADHFQFLERLKSAKEKDLYFYDQLFVDVPFT